ncbi:MAG: UDP-3-O-(3-hydroxymyristoyl)glucosamine N-acyltransferase, partial [Gemmatimonadota bacterium]|nr:UDP-3-O-(3-hydroxymyristoyl)glucosamine N-acyltransferase [Gemmatimonadota bacterium]
NTTVDRGSIGHTVIGNESGIADLVHVGHNVRVGDSVAIDALSGLAGSAVLGNDVTISGQGAVVGHLSVGNQVRLAWRGAISQDVPDGEGMAGAPARPRREVRRADALLFRLPRLLARLRALERAVLGGGRPA